MPAPVFIISYVSGLTPATPAAIAGADRLVIDTNVYSDWQAAIKNEPVLNGQPAPMLDELVQAISTANSENRLSKGLVAMEKCNKLWPKFNTSKTIALQQLFLMFDRYVMNGIDPRPFMRPDASERIYRHFVEDLIKHTDPEHGVPLLLDAGTNHADIFWTLVFDEAWKSLNRKPLADIVAAAVVDETVKGLEPRPGSTIFEGSQPLPGSALAAWLSLLSAQHNIEWAVPKVLNLPKSAWLTELKRKSRKYGTHDGLDLFKNYFMDGLVVDLWVWQQSVFRDKNVALLTADKRVAGLADYYVSALLDDKNIIAPPYPNSYPRLLALVRDMLFGLAGKPD